MRSVVLHPIMFSFSRGMTINLWLNVKRQKHGTPEQNNRFLGGSIDMKTIYSIARIGSLAATLAVLQDMYKIGVVGYVMICLTAIIWSFTEWVECGK